MRSWILLLSACGTPPPIASNPHQRPSADNYVVSTDASLRQLTVLLCFPGEAPHRLIPGAPVGAEGVIVEALGADNAVQTLIIEAGGVTLPSGPPGACVRFRSDLAALAAASGDGASDTGVWLLWPALWLWRPAAPPADWTATLRFELPAGVHVSAPWTPDAAGLRPLVRSALTARARVALGRFPQWIEVVGGARLEVSAVGSLPPHAVLSAWVRSGARGVAAVFGQFPRAAAQVLLIGVPGRGVQFGTALRGGGPAVTLWVGRDSSFEDLRNDWTLSHELFHLGMPWVPAEAAWFAEGITQYYSHVAQARAGAISAEAAWAEILDGFSRGRGAGRGESVVAESAALSRRHNYWWVYWGAAAWALRLDVALRKHGQSLDAVLRRWNRHPCCAAPRLVASLLAEAEALVGAQIFDVSVLEHPEFPDVSPALRWLGVAGDGARVHLDLAAPGAAAAREIMGVESSPEPR